MPQKTLTVTVKVQGEIARKTVVLPNGHNFKRVKLVITTNFTQADVNTVFGDYPPTPAQLLVDNDNNVLVNEIGETLVWV